MITRRHLFMPWVAGALGGCAVLGDLAQSLSTTRQRAVAPDWGQLVLAATADANGRSPVAVDILFIRDPALVEVLASTPAAKWFATRIDLERTFPSGLSVLSHEVVPRQSLRIERKTLAAQTAMAVLVFAGYPTPGDHRARLRLDVDGYLIELGARGFQAQALQVPRR